MTAPWSSEPNSRGVVPTRSLRGQLLLVGSAAILVIGGILLWRIGIQTAPAPLPVVKMAVSAPPAKSPEIEELVKATRALNDSQQQAIDQLQVLQDTVASQAAALKASSDQVSDLNNKLEALRQSFASTQPAADPEVKAERETRRSPPRQRHKARRLAKRHGARAQR